MRLKPISKASAQHTGRCPRASTLHNEVLAIEEIRRVAWVRRHYLEAGERLELRGRPLPALSHQAVEAKCAA